MTFLRVIVVVEVVVIVESPQTPEDDLRYIYIYINKYIKRSGSGSGQPLKVRSWT